MESADKKNIYMIVEGDRMQTGEKKNNLGIFVFYDKDGIVDRTIFTGAVDSLSAGFNHYV